MLEDADAEKPARLAKPFRFASLRFEAGALARFIPSWLNNCRNQRSGVRLPGTAINNWYENRSEAGCLCEFQTRRMTKSSPWKLKHLMNNWYYYNCGGSRMALVVFHVLSGNLSRSTNHQRPVSWLWELSGDTHSWPIVAAPPPTGQICTNMPNTANVHLYTWHFTLARSFENMTPIVLPSKQEAVARWLWLLQTWLPVRHESTRN